MKIWYIVLKPAPMIDPKPDQKPDYTIDRVELKKPTGLPDEWKVAELIPLKDVTNMIQVIEDAAEVFQEYINGKIKTDSAQAVVDGLRDLIAKG